MREDAEEAAAEPWPRAANRIRVKFLNDQRDYIKELGTKSDPSYTITYRLLDSLSKDAVLKVVETAPDRAELLADRLEEAHQLTWGLIYAGTSNEDDWSKREAPDFWRHAHQPGYEIKNKTYKKLMRFEVEGAASAYLNSVLRAELFDRTLVDMLIALELYLFADEMVHPYRIPGLPTNSPLKWPHPLWSSFLELAGSTLVLGAIGGLAASLVSNDTIGAWGNWIGVGCLLLWVIVVVLNVVTLPSRWSVWSKARKKTRTLLASMLSVYGDMASESVISAQHILDRVKAAANDGVVWPSPLYVVLEDVIARSGRF